MILALWRGDLAVIYQSWSCYLASLDREYIAATGAASPEASVDVLICIECQSSDTFHPCKVNGGLACLACMFWFMVAGAVTTRDEAALASVPEAGGKSATWLHLKALARCRDGSHVWHNNGMADEGDLVSCPGLLHIVSPQNDFHGPRQAACWDLHSIPCFIRHMQLAAKLMCMRARQLQAQAAAWENQALREL